MTVILDASKLTDHVMALQNAVDGNDPDIILIGTFDFKTDGSVTIRKRVNLGKNPQASSKPIIMGGKVPLNVAAKDKVTISFVRFEGPTLVAIQVNKVDNLMISDCEIINVKPVQVTVPSPNGETFFTAAGITISGGASGMLTIFENTIDMQAGLSNRTLGIVLIDAGSANAAQVSIVSNHVSGATAFGLDCRNIRGPVSIQSNRIEMSPVGVNKTDFLVSGIRCLGLGHYEVSKNQIESRFERGAGIRLRSDKGDHKVFRASVDSNIITMSLAVGVSPDRLNTGIEVRGFGEGNIVSNNTISGRANAALAVVIGHNAVHNADEGDPKVEAEFFGEFPTQTILAENHFNDFVGLTADIIVGENVTDTLITAPTKPINLQDGPWIGRAGTVKDLGTRTIIRGDYFPAA